MYQKIKPIMGAVLWAFAALPAAAEEFYYGPQPFGPLETTGEWRTFESKVAGPVRYYVAKPRDNRQYPGVFYIYGRPGLDHRLFPEIRRLASFGYTVAVVHFQEALLIPILIDTADPPEAMDVQREGFEQFLKLPERKPGKVCIVATVRGGTFGTVLSATRPEVACYVGLHPVIIDHSKPEPFQDTDLLKEARDLKVPTLLMVGDSDFEVRVTQSKRLAEYMQERGRPVELVVYPKGTRGFDFRVIGRSLADDLAKVDSMNRTIWWVKKYLEGIEPPIAMSANTTAPLPAMIRPPTVDERGKAEGALPAKGAAPDPSAESAGGVVASTAFTAVPAVATSSSGYGVPTRASFTTPPISTSAPAPRPARVVAAVAPAPAASGAYALQVAAYRSDAEATVAVQRLKAGGIDAVARRAEVPGKGTWYRVRVGSFADSSAAASMKTKLEQQGYEALLVRE